MNEPIVTLPGSKPAKSIKPGKPKRKWPLWVRLPLWIAFWLIVGPILWVALYAFMPVPGTYLMVQRAFQGDHIQRQGVSINNISPHLVRAVMAGEDAKFCAHHGFDVEAIQKALKNNARGRKLRGGSTISQQTAKNLFLWPQRSWLRKGFEAYFTVLMEVLWPKRRIMETYLNAGEWGDGVFGAELAARANFGKFARDLTRTEAARLAAILPSPNKWSADALGPLVRSRTARILGNMRVIENEGLAACVLRK